MATPNKLSALKIRAIRAHRLSGETYLDIAVRFDVSEVTISRVCKDLPKPPRRPHTNRKVDPARAERLVQSGVPARVVAERFGVKLRSLYVILCLYRKRAGIAAPAVRKIAS